MKTLYMFYAKNWMKKISTIVLICFAMFFSLIPWTLIGNSWVNFNQMQLSSAVVFAIVLTVVISINNIMIFGSNFLETRKTIMLKNFAMTDMTKNKFILTHFLWIFTTDIILMISILAFVNIGSGMGVYTQFHFFANTNFMGFLWGFVFLCISTFAVGLLLSQISSSNVSFNVLSFVSLIFVILWTALFFDTYTSIAFGSDKNPYWLNYFKLFIGANHSLELIAHSLEDARVWNLVEGYTVSYEGKSLYIDGTQTNLNIWIPMVYSILDLSISYKLFKWDRR